VKQPLEIVDLGCGGGDMLIEIARYGRKRNIPFKLIGIDANPHIIEFAKKNCEAYPEIEFLTLDIFSSEFKKLRFDVAIATLVTHHFESTSLSQLCATLQRQSKLGVVINDLHRHWLAYYSIKVLTLAFSKSSMVKYDAPLSVLRSFKKNEWLQILHQGGISNYSITWKWAFRWQLVIPASLA
ncbi:MAG: methyltransferase domain-containing protein, partial [Cyclobacteriaceae bacterium]